MTKHNYITRDIKDLGQCPACDEHHNKYYLKKGYENLQQENERLKKALEVAEGAWMYRDWETDRKSVV